VSPLERIEEDEVEEEEMGGASSKSNSDIEN
jgi:hypothetical protein